MATTLPIGAFGASNCVRLDFEPFTFFIPVFRNADSFFAHAHEDTLSYVVFAHGDEVLIDPGRRSFLAADRASALAPAHNGLCDATAAIAPLRRFFFNRALRAEPVDAGSAEIPGGVRFWARNRLLGVKRELKIVAAQQGSVLVEEEFESLSGNPDMRFSHLFAGSGTRLVANTAVTSANGCTIEYGVPPQTLVLKDTNRSKSYGESEAAQRIVAQLAATAGRATMRWTLRTK